MVILKIEQNLYEEIKKIPGVKKEEKGDALFLTIDVDFFDGVQKMTVEKRKYPYFYKYYLYLDGDYSEPVSLKEEKGARFLLAFYLRFCPDYVKNPEYQPDLGMKAEEYFYMERIPGASMQHFIPGKGLVEEVLPEEKREAQGYRALDGYHEFSKEEKADVGSQLDALKNQFADQLKDLNALLSKKGE